MSVKMDVEERKVDKSLTQDIEKIKNSKRKNYRAQSVAILKVMNLKKVLLNYIRNVGKNFSKISEAKQNEENVDTFTFPSKRKKENV